MCWLQMKRHAGMGLQTGFVCSCFREVYSVFKLVGGCFKGGRWGESCGSNFLQCKYQSLQRTKQELQWVRLLLLNKNQKNRKWEAEQISLRLGLCTAGTMNSNTTDGSPELIHPKPLNSTVHKVVLGTRWSFASALRYSINTCVPSFSFLSM